MKRLFSSKRQVGILLCCVGIFCSLFSFGLGLPHVGPNATNNNLYALIARNSNRFGFWKTGFAPLVSVSPSMPESPSYYFHHPPLVSWIIAIAFRVFGESFLTARLVSFFFCSAIFILLIALAREYEQKHLVMMTAAVACVCPALVVFGKLVGQEPLVLCAVLLSLYALIKYSRTEQHIWRIVLFLTALFGMLSDWPFAYWSVCLFPVFLFFRKPKLGMLYILWTTAISFGILLWISSVMHGWSDLFSALHNRSLGVLLTQSYWPLRWISIIVVRLCIYTTPFVLPAFYFFFQLHKKEIHTHKFSLFFVSMCSLTLFGLLHILLYPEGSFGHPYWMFYLIPACTFSLAFVLASMSKRKALVLYGVIFCCSALVIYWKHKQVSSQVYRYELGKKVNTALPKQTTIAINDESVVDRDLWQYAFDREAYPVSFQEASTAAYLVYSCTACSLEDPVFAQYAKAYPSMLIQTTSAQAYIFSLRVSGQTQVIPQAKNSVEQHSSDSVMRKTLRFVKDFLGAAQI